MESGKDVGGAPWGLGEGGDGRGNVGRREEEGGEGFGEDEWDSLEQEQEGYGGSCEEEEEQEEEEEGECSADPDECYNENAQEGGYDGYNQTADDGYHAYEHYDRAG